MTTNQKTQLQEIIQVEHVHAGDVLWREGSKAEFAVIVGEDATLKVSSCRREQSAGECHCKFTNIDMHVFFCVGG
jgi:hypothetical protein